MESAEELLFSTCLGVLLLEESNHLATTRRGDIYDQALVPLPCSYAWSPNARLVRVVAVQSPKQLSKALAPIRMWLQGA